MLFVDNASTRGKICQHNLNQDVAKLRSVFHFDAFSKLNETKFETKWPISNFFLKKFDQFRSFWPPKLVLKLFQKISIVDLRIEKD